MSFINVFEELSKLYESKEEQPEVETVEEEASKVESSEEERLTEDVEEDAIDEEPAEEPTEEPAEEEQPEEEHQEEEPKHIILECANCGGLIIKDESDVKVDETSDLANVEESCQYCEEMAGYKIVGIVAPYEVEEAAEDEGTAFTDDETVEESLLDVNLPIDVDVQANGNDVSVGTLG